MYKYVRAGNKMYSYNRDKLSKRVKNQRYSTSPDSRIIEIIIIRLG